MYRIASSGHQRMAMTACTKDTYAWHVCMACLLNEWQCVPHLAQQQQRVQAPALEDQRAADDADHCRHNNVCISRNPGLHVAHLHGNQAQTTVDTGADENHLWIAAALLRLLFCVVTCSRSTPHPINAAPSTNEGLAKSTLTIALAETAYAREGLHRTADDLETLRGRTACKAFVTKLLRASLQQAAFSWWRCIR